MRCRPRARRSTVAEPVRRTELWLALRACSAQDVAERRSSYERSRCAQEKRPRKKTARVWRFSRVSGECLHSVERNGSATGGLGRSSTRTRSATVMAALIAQGAAARLKLSAQLLVGGLAIELSASLRLKSLRDPAAAPQRRLARLQAALRPARTVRGSTFAVRTECMRVSGKSG